ncbi:hypothetical protein LCGC14_1973960 [marine sediment metagenome]|uniref:Uncharacterized protein n=1 Tax=marine sediment metagenome TaxID=412755 RepID=A0A0F9FBB0_9ZZZZ
MEKNKKSIQDIKNKKRLVSWETLDEIFEKFKQLDKTKDENK